jgi:hypothetical protein
MEEEVKGITLVRKSKAISFPGRDPMIIHDLENDSYYFVEGVGREIWNMLDGTIGFDTIVEMIFRNYRDADKQTIEQDCLSFLVELIQNDLVEKYFVKKRKGGEI